MRVHTVKFSSIESAIWLAAGVAADGEGVGQFNDDARSLNTFLISVIPFLGCCHAITTLQLDLSFYLFVIVF